MPTIEVTAEQAAALARGENVTLTPPEPPKQRFAVARHDGLWIVEGGCCTSPRGRPGVRGVGTRVGARGVGTRVGAREAAKREVTFIDAYNYRKQPALLLP